jgi:dihydroxyacetone kinase-like protein
MKKIINRPADFVPEMLDGLVRAHGDRWARGADPFTLVRASATRPGKVALATGGGSGHLPVFLGYVGDGLLDGASIGDVFNSPSAEQMLSVTRQIHAGAGVVYIYGNYGGDIMNFDMATELADYEDIRVRSVVVKDDAASAPKAERSRRRGVAGMVLAFKIAGASADQMRDLDGVVAVTERALAGTATLGVALTPCTIPRAGKPSFQIADDEMEVGMGIHGEPGLERVKLLSADELASRICPALLDDLGIGASERLVVMVNGLGATPPEELYILFNAIGRLLDQRGIHIARAYVGEFATSMEMAGASVTFMRCDDEIIELLDAPSSTPIFDHFRARGR